MTLIKICGIHDRSTIPMLNQQHPDFVGFVFAPSKRQVTIEQAQQLRQSLDSHIKTVGVFVDASLDQMLTPYRKGIISYIQLHGHEDPEATKQLQNAGAKVIQVRHSMSEQQPTPADVIMYDGGAGTGTKLKWQFMANKQQPQFLAGGLDPNNVQKALKITNADGVDVSSGVETNGQKDPAKIKQFIRNVREMEEIQ